MGSRNWPKVLQDPISLHRMTLLGQATYSATERKLKFKYLHYKAGAYLLKKSFKIENQKNIISITTKTSTTTTTTLIIP